MIDDVNATLVALTIIGRDDIVTILVKALLLSKSKGDDLIVATVNDCCSVLMTSDNMILGIGVI